MKSNFLYILFALVLLSACGNSAKKDAKSTSDTVSISELKRESQISNLPVLEAYYTLKDALVASDVKLAEKKALLLAKAIKADNLNGNILIMAEAIAGAPDIKDQRFEFEKLSREIYAMAKKSNFGDATIYRLYCPMAFDNKGAFWLSNEQEIMNPYFGDKMLHCGRLEETITNQ
jgi:hypothetical protein